MVEEEPLGGSPKGGVEKKNQESESESHKDQDITKLLYFTRTQERRREDVFVCLGMEERGVYIVVVEKNMNRRSFNKG